MEKRYDNISELIEKELIKEEYEDTQKLIDVVPHKLCKFPVSKTGIFSRPRHMTQSITLLTGAPRG